jgi:hypothetical protein
MSYTSALAKIAAANRHQIELDLASAVKDREGAQVALQDSELRITLLRCLLNMRGEPPPEASEPPPATPGGPSGTMTLHAAMHKVLKEAPGGKLRAGEILAEIERQGLYRMRDGRQPESQQIHARANHYPNMFGKEGSYFYAK